MNKNSLKNSLENSLHHAERSKQQKKPAAGAIQIDSRNINFDKSRQPKFASCGMELDEIDDEVIVFTGKYSAMDEHARDTDTKDVVEKAKAKRAMQNDAVTVNINVNAVFGQSRGRGRGKGRGRGGYSKSIGAFTNNDK